MRLVQRIAKLRLMEDNQEILLDRLKGIIERYLGMCGTVVDDLELKKAIGPDSYGILISLSTVVQDFFLVNVTLLKERGPSKPYSLITTLAAKDRYGAKPVFRNATYFKDLASLNSDIKHLLSQWIKDTCQRVKLAATNDSILASFVETSLADSYSVELDRAGGEVERLTATKKKDKMIVTGTYKLGMFQGQVTLIEDLATNEISAKIDIRSITVSDLTEVYNQPIPYADLPCPVSKKDTTNNYLKITNCLDKALLYLSDLSRKNNNARTVKLPAQLANVAQVFLTRFYATIGVPTNYFSTFADYFNSGKVPENIKELSGGQIYLVVPRNDVFKRAVKQSNGLPEIDVKLIRKELKKDAIAFIKAAIK